MTRLLLVLAFVLMLPTTAFALPVTFTATLSGANENPPNASPGTGTALVTYNGITQTLTLSITFSGLAAPDTAALIHCCVSPPGNAGVATAAPAFPGFPLGVTSGTYNGTLDLTQSSSYSPAFVTANGGVFGAETAFAAGLNAGQAYLNIHTSNFPGGEIRGNLTPEPTTTMLLGAGLVGLAVARRRRGRAG